MLNPLESQTLYKLAEKNPALALVRMFSILQDQISSTVASKIKELDRTVSEETLLRITASVTERVKKDLPNYDSILSSIRGEDGEDADTEDVARILCEMPEFIEMTKAKDGEPGHTPTAEELAGIIKPLIPPPVPGAPGKDADPREVAKSLMYDARFIEYVKGKQGEPGAPGKDGSPDEPKDIAAKLNTLEGAVDQKVIKGLPKTLESLQQAIRERGGGKSGGGIGNIQHESKSVSEATTQITTNFPIAGGGFAVWAYYQGALIMRGEHYTVNADRKTLPLTFTPIADTKIDLIYIRG